MYHALDDQFRPLRPSGPGTARPPRFLSRYRNLIYGFTKVAAMLDEGLPDKPVKVPVKPPDQATAVLGPDGRPLRTG